VLSSTNAPPALRIGGRGRLTVGAAVAAVVDTIGQTNATVADVRVLAEILRNAMRDGVSPDAAAVRIGQQAPIFRPLEEWMRRNSASFAVLVAVVSTVLSLLQLLQGDDQPKPAPPPPPAPVQQLDRAEIERIVREQQRELTDQDEPPAGEPGKR
jgi:hypothetical protein